MEMKQLMNMRFPDGLAAQALEATGGKSVVEATEWILSHTVEHNTPPCDSTNNNFNSNPINPSSLSTNPPPFQPKIDSFFHFQSMKEQEVPYHRIINEKEESRLNSRKRPKQHTSLSSSKRIPLSSSPTLHHNLPHEPLSERMRPRTIDDVVGQDHLLANNCLLRSAIDCNRLPSIVFWGPPGTGKTSLAKAIVNSSSSSYRFVSLSAVICGVKDVRDAVEEARKWKLKNNKRTVLFVDEVHRFNKSQQDSFLPVIEDGSVVFMGATTENPSFHLITPLLSRCRVLTLNPLKPHHVATLLKRSAADSEKGLVQSITRATPEEEGGMRIEVNDKAVEFLSWHCDGDARVALNALEISATTAAVRARARLAKATSTTPTPNKLSGGGGDIDDVLVATVTLDDAKEALQCKHIAYDKAGEEHYNLISALHKSMRGNDADAAIYWLARMLEGGEEPLYIARRLIRFASEDVGLADPSSLTLAVACYQACHFLGMPECNVNLAQCVAYLALASKSVAVYRALESALKVVRESVGQNERVPLHLRNAPTKLVKELGYGKGYIYPPDNPSSSQTYLPSSLQGYKFLYWPNSSNCDQ